MTGWTWDEISEFTLPRLAALNKGWSNHPPLAAMLANRWGYTKASRTRGTARGVPEHTDTNDHSELAGLFGGGPSKIDKGLKHG